MTGSELAILEAFGGIAVIVALAAGIVATFTLG